MRSVTPWIEGVSSAQLDPCNNTGQIVLLYFVHYRCYIIPSTLVTMSLYESGRTSVDDNGSISESRMNKRKALSQIKPMTPASVVNKLYSLVVCNIFEIVWIQRSEGQDSNTFPFFASVRDGGAFARTHGVIMMANRRASFDREHAVRNMEDGYMRRYYIRIVENNDFNQQSRLEFLVDVADVSKISCT